MYKIVYEEQLHELGRQAIELTSLTVHRHYERQMDLGRDRMDKDVMWIGPLPPQYVTGLDKMAELLEPELEVLFSVEREEYQVVYEGEDSCLVVGRYLIRSDKSSGIFICYQQRVSFFFQLTDGHLKIVHMHVSHPHEMLSSDEMFPFRFGKEAYDFIAQTNKLAFLDSLTGIANRNAYENDLMILSEHIFEHNPLGIALFDLNNLKIINDTQGHLAGDTIISEFAKLLREAMPSTVKVYRYGGDEFAALFKNMSRGQVQDALGRLGSLKEAYNADNTTPISFACGYSFFTRETDTCLTEMVCRADALLYANKKAIKQLQESHNSE